MDEKHSHRVMVMECENYDRDAIHRIVREGMRPFDYHPRGSIFVKPNVVFASHKGRYGATAYTHPAVMGSSLAAISEQDGVKRVDVGEKTAIGYPTRLCYRYADYYKEIRCVRQKAKVPVRLFCIDEERRDRVFVGGGVHDNLRISSKMARADSKVYLPKLKCHCVSKMTGAVKLNIGICSDDERAIRHDFMLNEKIVDLLSVGMPDFIIMDAINVGVGNEAVPTPRRLGLILMGTNPLAVDIVGARLLGHELEDVPYLKRAVERGYGPASIDDVELIGDLTSISDVDRAAMRILPYDDAFYHWQDIKKELVRLKSPIRFYWGYTHKTEASKCETGCIMGLKMFFGFLETYAGSEAFRTANPAVIVVGQVGDAINAAGNEVFLVGSCAQAANVRNAKKITRIDHCFTTAVELAQIIRGRLGISAPIMDLRQVLPLVVAITIASVMKVIRFRYAQDFFYFLKNSFQKKI